MRRLVIRPLHWAEVPELNGVTPLDADDLACMAELRDVLERHRRLHRFALHLVHRHFDLAADEVLVEYTDERSREQRLHVEPRASAALRDAVATTWRFDAASDAGEPFVACVCATRDGQGHLGRHESR
jgi:hypothetical protein